MVQALQIQSPVTADNLYLGVQHFYAKQMQLLDAGKVQEWADTFTDDGVFDTAGIPEPVRGRANIAAGAGRVAAQYAEAGIARRHWIGMLAVEIRDGWVYTRSYALVLEIPKGGEVIARRSTLCEDSLVPDGDSWLVRHRLVTRDGLD